MKILKIMAALAACLSLCACVSRQTEPIQRDSAASEASTETPTEESSAAEGATEDTPTAEHSGSQEEVFAEAFGADRVFCYMAGDESCAVLYGTGVQERGDGIFHCDALNLGLYSYGQAEDSGVVGSGIDIDPAGSGISFDELWGGTLYIPYIADGSGVSAQFWAAKGGRLSLFTGDFSHVGREEYQTVEYPEFTQTDNEHDSLTDSDGNIWRFDFTAGKYYVLPADKPQKLPPVEYTAAYSYSTCPAVFSCEIDSSGMTEEQAARSALDILADKYISGMMEESPYREFRILEYKDVVTEVIGRTDEVYSAHLEDYRSQDESNVWKSLENWEVSENTWLVDFSAKFRAEGSIREFKFTADTSEWYDTPYAGYPPQYYMLCRDGDTWYLWSRAAYSYFPSGDIISVE